MKLFLAFLVIFFSFYFQKTGAQNWHLVDTGKTFHYSCDTTNTIFSLWADSLIVSGTDTVYFTNRVILPCDTCHPENYSGISATSFMLKNQPLFLRRNINFTENGIVILNSPDTIVLDLKTQTGNSWVMDTSANVNATVYFKGLDYVLGVQDSLMGILLNSSDTIILSKNHGVVQWPCITGSYFRLIGIEGQDTIGYHVPGSIEIFNFQVGAVFKLNEGEGYPDYQHNVESIFRIEQVLSDVDYELYYRIRGCRWVYHSDYWTNTYYTSSDTINEYYNPCLYGTDYPINSLDFPINKFRSFQDTVLSTQCDVFYSACYYIIKLYLQNGLTFFEQEPLTYHPLNDDTNFYYVSNDILINDIFGEPVTHHILIIEKSGLMENLFLDFEYGIGHGTSDLNLTGDSTGLQCTCCQLSIEKNSGNNLKIYPNPTQDFFYISGIENGSVEIYTMLGQKIYQSAISETEINEPVRIDVRNSIKSGIYILKVISKDKTSSFKFVVE